MGKITNMSDLNQPININDIMQDVRRQIIEQRQGIDDIAVKVKGEKLPAAFYEHLYLASMTYNQTETELYVTPSSVPLIGGLIDRLRRQIHNVVIFYVNRSVAKQIQINRHLLQALSILAEAYEADKPVGERDNPETPTDQSS